MFKRKEVHQHIQHATIEVNKLHIDECRDVTQRLSEVEDTLHDLRIEFKEALEKVQNGA
jgi:hypothetical protein